MMKINAVLFAGNAPGLHLWIKFYGLVNFDCFEKSFMIFFSDN